MKSLQVTTGTAPTLLAPREATRSVTFDSATTTVDVAWTGATVSLVGNLVFGAAYPAGTRVLSVNPGVGFTTSAAPTVSATGAELVNDVQFAGWSAKPRSVLIKNTDATNGVYLGGSDVASTNGFLLSAGLSITVDLTADSVYAVAAAGTPVVHLLWTS